MTATQRLAKLGYGLTAGFRGLREVLKTKKSRVSPQAREREQFEDDVRQQFQQLKDKGLSIPIFTL